MNKFIAKYSIYLWFLRKMIGKVNTVLDLGCGEGEFMESLQYGRNWEITGIDVDQRYLNKAKTKKIYKQLIKGDLIKVLEKLIKEKKQFDLVFCSQVIEHLKKEEGEKLLDLLEKVVLKKIFISTPNGFMHQPEEYFDDNPYQIHRSGWEEADFKKRGYSVYGVGFIPIWSEGGIAHLSNKILFVFSYVLSYLLSPIIYFNPYLASGLFCIKKI